MAPKKRLVPAAAEPIRKKPAVKLPAVTPGRVPIFVMLPLDWMSDDGLSLRRPEELKGQLVALKHAGVRGVMGDVWWGLCEPAPQVYHFAAVKELCGLLETCGLKFQATMAFHKCGGNVGDAANYPLPSWALDPARSAGLLYTSRDGVVSEDCLSLSADKEPIFPSSSGTVRTALSCYRDYIANFVTSASMFLGSTIVELQVGMGPCGELRYPSYMLSAGWNYPGIGMVMAHDSGMLKMLQQSTTLTEPPPSLPAHKEQNTLPDQCAMFAASEQHFRACPGKEFLTWYSKALLDHGAAVLDAAEEALAGKVDVKTLELSVKVSGLHWHVMHPSRATEACAGYDCCSDPQADAYSEIAGMLSSFAAKTGRPTAFNFTCLEMNNCSEGMPEAFSAPEDLIAQVRRACVAHNVPLSGENALEFPLDSGSWAFDQMRKQLRGWSDGRDRMHALTLLRLNKDFVSDESLLELGKFVSKI